MEDDTEHVLVDVLQSKQLRHAGKWLAICSCGWQTPPPEYSETREGAEAGWRAHALPPEAMADPLNPEFSALDAEFLREAGIVTPLPDQAPWHPCLMTLVRMGLCVTPIPLEGKGEVWAVGVRFANRNTFGLITLGADEDPHFALAFRLDGSESWREEMHFLRAVGDWYKEWLKQEGDP